MIRIIYVISDLHGCPFKDFTNLLKKVNFNSNDFLYVLGDVIDRGNDGIKLLKLIMSKRNIKFILGNHEEMLLACDFLFEEINEYSINNLTGQKLYLFKTWLLNGGQATINELSIKRKEEIKYILEYLRKAPLYETVSVNGQDFILTHAGLGNFRQDKMLEEYTHEELIWARPKISDKYHKNIITVFGHTPTVYYGEKYKGKALVTPTWIDIDVGISLGLKPMIFRLDDMEAFYL